MPAQKARDYHKTKEKISFNSGIENKKILANFKNFAKRAKEFR